MPGAALFYTHFIIDDNRMFVGRAFDFPKPAFADMESLLRFLFRTSEKEPLILVLDEYPYLRENVKGLDSVLQSVIDEYRDRSNMKFIICGSYVDTMKELLAKQNPLYGRIDLTLSSEISKITNANEVFEALAKGFSRYKDILDQSHVSSGPALVDVLDKLIRMDVVAKITPINDENNRKKSGYFISDNLSLFYYKYIFRNISRMNIMDSDIFYEAKFRKEPVTAQMIQEEIRQVEQTGLECYKYGFFSRSGFACEEADNWNLIEMRELYK